MYTGNERGLTKLRLRDAIPNRSFRGKTRRLVTRIDRIRELPLDSKFALLASSFWQENGDVNRCAKLLGTDPKTIEKYLNSVRNSEELTEIFNEVTIQDDEGLNALDASSSPTQKNKKTKKMSIPAEATRYGEEGQDEIEIALKLGEEYGLSGMRGITPALITVFWKENPQANAAFLERFAHVCAHVTLGLFVANDETQSIKIRPPKNKEENELLRQQEKATLEYLLGSLERMIQTGSRLP